MNDAALKVAWQYHCITEVVDGLMAFSRAPQHLDQESSPRHQALLLAGQTLEGKARNLELC